MGTCAVCGVAVSGVEVMYTADARIVCPRCFAAIDPIRVPSGGPWKGFAIAGAVIAAVPFAVRMSTVSSTSFNGEVTSFVYRDWIAVICGVIALVLGAAALWMARGETLRRGLAIAAGLGVIAFGGFQIARGFGVFEQPPGGTSMPTITMDPPPPRAVADPSRPETCTGTCFELGRKLEAEKDFERAIVAYTRACEEKSISGCFNAGFLLKKAAKPAFDKAHALFVRGCELADAASCNEAALDFKLGRGAPKDLVRARKMFEEGCTNSVALACANLADFYDNGIEVDIDLKRALELFVKSCDLEDPDAALACDRAGIALYTGKGTKTDTKRAAEYFGKGCKLAPAYCYNLGVLHEEGKVVAKDLEKARELYDKACKADDRSACNNLGHFLDKGLGGPKDRAAAKQLFQKSCDAGLELGCTNLKAIK